jgi:hypothetical protein
VKQRIEAALSVYSARFVVVPVPNITNVFYGREVGYAIERIVLDETIEGSPPPTSVISAPCRKWAP